MIPNTTSCMDWSKRDTPFLQKYEMPVNYVFMIGVVWRVWLLKNYCVWCILLKEFGNDITTVRLFDMKNIIIYFDIPRYKEMLLQTI